MSREGAAVAEGRTPWGSRRGLQLATVVAVQQPTFDMSVLRAVFDQGRTGHEEAARLLKLATDGVLEIGVPPQGAQAGFRGDMTTPLARRVLTLLASPGVVELRQLAVPWT
jgi:hypothetical protein